MVEIDVHQDIFREIQFKGVVQHLFISLEGIEKEKYFLLGARNKISFVWYGFYYFPALQFGIALKNRIPG